MSKFSSIQIGDKAEIKHLITGEDIRKFVSLTGDDNKLHVDADYAAKTEFKKTVVHGMLGASFISTIIGTKMPGDGALWFSQSLEFLLPARVGDEITVVAEVIGKSEKNHTIELTTNIYNQHKQKITAGTAKVKLVELLEDDTIPTNEIAQPVRNALIIGATGGIGQEVCLRLAKEGFNIAVHYHTNNAAAEKLAEAIEKAGGKSLIVSGDVLDPLAIKQMVAEINRKLGNITAFVNCATLKVPNISFEQMEWTQMEGHLNINIKSNFYLLKEIIPAMKINNGGKIVLITTQYTESTPPAELSGYVTAKYALNGFAKSLAAELAQKGININLVSPGMTLTDLIADIPEKTRLLAAAKTPMRRLAKTADVAAAVSFLLSKDADYLTGETIRVNGGQTML